MTVGDGPVGQLTHVTHVMESDIDVPDADPGGGQVDVTDLYERMWSPLVVLATGLTGARSTGEDVVQDVFEALHARRRRVDTEAQGAAYLRGAVVKRCRHVHRRVFDRRRYAHLETELSGATTAIEPHDLDVLRAVAALPRRDREVVVLRYWLDLPYDEIAAALDSTPRVVARTAARARTRLAAVLEDRS